MTTYKWRAIAWITKVLKIKENVKLCIVEGAWEELEGGNKNLNHQNTLNARMNISTNKFWNYFTNSMNVRKVFLGRKIKRILLTLSLRILYKHEVLLCYVHCLEFNTTRSCLPAQVCHLCSIWLQPCGHRGLSAAGLPLLGLLNLVFLPRKWILAWTLVLSVGRDYRTNQVL